MDNKDQEHRELPCQRTRELDRMWTAIGKLEVRAERQGLDLATMRGKGYGVAAVIALVVSAIPAILRFVGGS